MLIPNHTLDSQNGSSSNVSREESPFPRFDPSDENKIKHKNKSTVQFIRSSTLTESGRLKKKSKHLLYPDSNFITFWDMLMTLVLLLTSVFRPYQVAFRPELIYTPFWNVINLIAELLFFFDIIIDFNTAQQGENFKLIEDRKVIA